MSKPLIAIGSWERLVPGTGWLQTDARAYRASMGEKRLTIFDLFCYPARTHRRLPRFSSKPPLDEVYNVHAGLGQRVRITLKEYPTNDTATDPADLRKERIAR